MTSTLLDSRVATTLNRMFAEADAQMPMLGEMFDRQAVCYQLGCKCDDLRCGAAQRLEVHDLRAHVGVQADDLEAGAVAHAPAELSRIVNRNSKLVRLEARGDVRMAARARGRRCVRALLPTRR